MCPDSNVYLEDIFKIFLSDISDVFKMFSQIYVGDLIRQWRSGLEDVFWNVRKMFCALIQKPKCF